MTTCWTEFPVAQIVAAPSEGMTVVELKETWNKFWKYFQMSKNETIIQSLNKYGLDIYLVLVVAPENCFQMSSSLTSEPQ